MDTRPNLADALVFSRQTTELFDGLIQATSVETIDRLRTELVVINMFFNTGAQDPDQVLSLYCDGETRRIDGMFGAIIVLRNTLLGLEEVDLVEMNGELFLAEDAPTITRGRGNFSILRGVRNLRTGRLSLREG